MERDESTAVQCRHHWVLGQPHQGVVQGACRNCGAKREYPAFLDDYGFEPDRATTREDWLVTGAGGARPSQPFHTSGTRLRLLGDSES